VIVRLAGGRSLSGEVAQPASRSIRATLVDDVTASSHGAVVLGDVEVPVILEGDEPQRIAQQLLHDVRTNAESDGLTIYDALTGRDDAIAIGRCLIGPLTEARRAFQAGDRSPGTLRLVALAEHVEQQRRQDEADAHRQRLEKLKTKALRLTGNPELAAVMTIDSGISCSTLWRRAARTVGRSGIVTLV
jgi:hypothetical protein